MVLAMCMQELDQGTGAGNRKARTLSLKARLKSLCENSAVSPALCESVPLSPALNSLLQSFLPSLRDSRFIPLSPTTESWAN